MSQHDAHPRAQGRLVVYLAMGMFCILALVMVLIAGLIMYMRWFEHGTSCGSGLGAGPETCTAAGGWGSPASIILGSVLALPFFAGAWHAVRMARSIWATHLGQGPIQ